MDLVSPFADAFDGNPTAFGTGAGQASCIRQPLNNERWIGHLDGTFPIGVYPIHGDHVVWGCIDFDVQGPNHKSFDFATQSEANNAVDTLMHVLANGFGIPSLYERTRSEGRHVWVFASEWVPARTMRRALLVASDIAGTPTREVNPKAETLPNGTLGNYVRLPYAGSFTDSYDPGCRPLSTAQYPLELRGFVQWHATHAVSLATLERAATLWKPPVQYTELPTFDPALLERTTDRDKNYLLAMIERGPGDDRSKWLFLVASHAYERGFRNGELRAWIDTADRRCGKWLGRRDRDHRIEDLARRVSNG
jgi:hypothetical protein